MVRTVAVSGAASGIGMALAELLRDQGDEVIGIDLRGVEVSADLSADDGRSSAVAKVLELSGGRLDAVVACAGVSGVDPRLVAVNYFGAVRLVADLRSALAASEQPRAAAVTSVSATHPVDQAIVDSCLADDEQGALAAAQRAVADGRGGQLYPSSKSALAKWVRRTSVAPDWADAGIPLNAVAPGVVLTPMTDALLADEKMREVTEQAVPMPLNGPCGPEVVARALGWLISEGNTHITGQVLFVDGGASATLESGAR